MLDCFSVFLFVSLCYPKRVRDQRWDWVDWQSSQCYATRQRYMGQKWDIELELFIQQIRWRYKQLDTDQAQWWSACWRSMCMLHSSGFDSMDTISFNRHATYSDCLLPPHSCQYKDAAYAVTLTMTQRPERQTLHARMKRFPWSETESELTVLRR